VRRSELVGKVATVPAFGRPRASLEQVTSPPEAVAELLETAERYTPLAGTPVTDLGCGTGRLAIAAALWGASPVVGVDVDPAALELAHAAAHRLGVAVRFVQGPVDTWREPTEVVVMNPPFGAQRRHADRPFWDTAFAVARRAVYAFALADSRTFIARRTVARGARITETHPVAWTLERTFPHHTRPRAPLSVDLWALATGTEP
jgi:putative methylase